MRKFYLMYPNFQISDKSSPIFQTSEKSDSTCQTVSDKLTWSHICELITIEDPLEREFYENECISENWGGKDFTSTDGERTLYASGC